LIKRPAVILLILKSVCAGAQTDTVIALRNASAAYALPEVVVRAYESGSALEKLPAAVSKIGDVRLGQYSGTTILPAVNSIPGVRMEERSPGSYRFGIRGSSASSPFGVRNIKVYYNDIPYTDAGGNTYLNQIGFYNISSLEIIKGPGSSLYGAGTGGVLLINSMPGQWQQGASVNYTGGSYALNNAAAEVRLGDSSFRNVVRYQHLSSDGYRIQTRMNKDVFSWDAIMAGSRRSELSAHFLYGNLYYQTPGALTLLQYDADPHSARPRAGAIPGAVEAGAAIYQTTLLAGLTYRQQFGDHWSGKTTLYGNYARQLNPNLRNYSRTSEPHFGGRSQVQYEHSLKNGSLQWLGGAELQQGLAQYRTYQNAAGLPQNLQSDQEVDNRLLCGFTQLTVQLADWIFAGGVSINQLNVTLRAIAATQYTEQRRTFSNELAPRIAVLRRLSNNLSVFASVAKGFTPPATAELVPTGSAVNFGLQPVQGWNYELGVKGNGNGHRLYYDVSIFYFALQNAIVQRRDSAAGDYYVNAGSTQQAGLEAYAAYKVLQQGNRFINDADIYAGYTGNYFRYDRFQQLASDYSGKQMPGIAPHTFSGGLLLRSGTGIYINVNYFYSDRIALDDGNTAYADAYNLLGAKLGHSGLFRRCSWNIYVGVDNILDERYSLGNDINAAAARYYNAAPPRNYYAGVSLGYSK